MPYDPNGSGLWFVWRRDGRGRSYRDFRFDEGGEPQCDDRFEFDKAGNPIQVRGKISGAGGAKLDS